MHHDLDTRKNVSDELKEKCPLRTVLKREKRCPYFGASGSCHDCSYFWPVVAESVLNLIKARRSSYEIERKRSKDYKAKLDLLMPVVEKLFFGFEALRKLDGLFSIDKDSEEEKND